MIAAISFLALPVLLLGLAFVVACFVFWVWMLVDAIQNKGLGDGEKVGWILAIIFLHALGALLYLLIGHPKRNAGRTG